MNSLRPARVVDQRGLAVALDHQLAKALGLDAAVVVTGVAGERKEGDQWLLGRDVDAAMGRFVADSPGLEKSYRDEYV